VNTNLSCENAACGRTSIRFCGRLNAAVVGIYVRKNIGLLNQKCLKQNRRMLIVFNEMKGARKTLGVGFCYMIFVLASM
jgi:hypothetical protein